MCYDILIFSALTLLMFLNQCNEINPLTKSLIGYKRHAQSCLDRVYTYQSERRKKQAKVNLFSFIREVKTEALRVVWPTRKEVGMSLGLVFVMVFASGLFFVAIDALFFKMIKFILG